MDEYASAFLRFGSWHYCGVWSCKRIPSFYVLFIYAYWLRGKI